MNVRGQLRKLQKKAAGLGVEEACRFFDMTPGEIALVLKSHTAMRQQQLQAAHLQAKLMALAVHAPRQLPPFPVFVPDEEMSWQEMKQRLLAGRRKEVP